MSRHLGWDMMTGNFCAAAQHATQCTVRGASSPRGTEPISLRTCSPMVDSTWLVGAAEVFCNFRRPRQPLARGSTTPALPG
eukprot:scaffold375_cov378-Prasinococcus_capsulatus_cf.AAC.37